MQLASQKPGFTGTVVWEWVPQSLFYYHAVQWVMGWVSHSGGAAYLNYGFRYILRKNWSIPLQKFQRISLDHGCAFWPLIGSANEGYIFWIMHFDEVLHRDLFRSSPYRGGLWRQHHSLYIMKAVALFTSLNVANLHSLQTNSIQGSI